MSPSTKVFLIQTITTDCFCLAPTGSVTGVGVELTLDAQPGKPSELVVSRCWWYVMFLGRGQGYSCLQGLESLQSWVWCLRQSQSKTIDCPEFSEVTQMTPLYSERRPVSWVL